MNVPVRDRKSSNKTRVEKAERRMCTSCNGRFWAWTEKPGWDKVTKCARCLWENGTQDERYNARTGSVDLTNQGGGNYRIEDNNESTL